MEDGETSICCFFVKLGGDLDVRCCQEALSKVVEPGLRLHHTVRILSCFQMSEMAEMVEWLRHRPSFLGRCGQVNRQIDIWLFHGRMVGKLWWSNKPVKHDEA